MSASNNILPKSVAATLKCRQCKQYLSVSPITFNSEGYQCGRCLQNQKKDPMVVATAYESLARITSFPCRFDLYGCSKYLNFNETEYHENECEFRRIKCPAMLCEKEVKISDIKIHFQSLHKELIINSNKFDIPLMQNILVNQLIILDDNIFVLEKCVSIETNTFWLGLRYLNKNTLPQPAFYQLEVKSENSNCLVLNKQQIMKYSLETNCLKTEMISFDYEVIKSVLKSEQFTFEVKLITDDQSHQNESVKSDCLLEELECIVCKEYMIPPIYICKTGHSLCPTCKMKVTECPMCKACFEGARNFALEKLTEHVHYPCKNQSKGCDYKGTAQNIRNHETKCLTRIIKCPLSSQEYCHWKGLLHQVYNHSRMAHPRRTWIKLNHRLFRNLRSTNTQDCHIVTYDDNLFKVCMKHELNNGSVCWAVEHIELPFTEKPQYHFILDFIDQTKTNRILSVNELCYGLQNPTDLFYNCIKLPYNLLKPFINNEGKLMFSINIQQIENKLNP